MIAKPTLIPILAAALGSGLIGGVFFAFSSFVMAALGRIPPGEGVHAMNAINVTVINPSFMTVFLGNALLCLGLAAGSFWLVGIDQRLVLAASLMYLIGSFGVTMLFNVPLNTQLAAVTGSEEPALWARYLTDWTFWNHVRAAASILSAALFMAALARA